MKSIGSGARTYHLHRRREVEVLIRLTACYKRVEEEIFRPASGGADRILSDGGRGHRGSKPVYVFVKYHYVDSIHQ